MSEVPSDKSILMNFKSNFATKHIGDIVDRARAERWSHTKTFHHVYMTMAAMEFQNLDADVKASHRREVRLEETVDNLLKEREEAKKRYVLLQNKFHRVEGRNWDLKEKMVEVRLNLSFCYSDSFVQNFCLFHIR